MSDYRQEAIERDRSRLLDRIAELEAELKAENIAHDRDLNRLEPQIVQLEAELAEAQAENERLRTLTWDDYFTTCKERDQLRADLEVARTNLDLQTQHASDWMGFADVALAREKALREELNRAALVMNQHIDEPQAVSHAELRATAREFSQSADTPHD